MKDSATNLGQKRDALKRIIRNPGSDTFYCDLLLWLIVPGEHSEELCGDLIEECSLRSSTEGEAAAKAWYRNQVIRSVHDYVWKRLERLAAIKFLMDTIRWWFRS
jgi:hypothetical protein